MKCRQSWDDLQNSPNSCKITILDLPSTYLDHTDDNDGLSSQWTQKMRTKDSFCQYYFYRFQCFGRNFYSCTEFTISNINYHHPHHQVNLSAITYFEREPDLKIFFKPNQFGALVCTLHMNNLYTRRKCNVFK